MLLYRVLISLPVVTNILGLSTAEVGEVHVDRCPIKVLQVVMLRLRGKRHGDKKHTKINAERVSCGSQPDLHLFAEYVIEHSIVVFLVLKAGGVW